MCFLNWHLLFFPKQTGPWGSGTWKKKTAHSALLETNSEFALENGWLEEVCRLPFGGQEMPIFRGALSGCWFQGGYGVDFPMAQKQLRPHCTCDQSAHPKLHRPGTPPGAILQLPPKKNRNPEKKILSVDWARLVVVSIFDASSFP